MSTQAAAPPPDPGLIARLEAHRTIGHVPRVELEWLARHGNIYRFEAGELLARKGQTVDEYALGLAILFSGRFSIVIDRGSGPRRVMDWGGGDITGYLPYSRMNVAPGDTVADTAGEALSIPRSLFPEMIRECPTVTATCVHVMLDRTRIFNTSYWQDEKVASLGKLAAGLAHELNNPASAVERGGRRLRQIAEDEDAAVRSLALLGLDEAQMRAVDELRTACTPSPNDAPLPPLRRAERENAISSWLLRRGLDDPALEPLLETSVTIDELDRLVETLGPGALEATLRWVAASCAVRAFANETELAGRRISEIVATMKRLTHMDRGTAAEPLDLLQGVRDTLTVLRGKIRDKNVAIELEFPSDLPRVFAIGGELNQVWMNLLENAIDAVDHGGHVRVGAASEGSWLVVRIVDDGIGIAPADQPRIFDPFFTTKPPGSGLGLGLEVARAQVRGSGGDIDFDSVPGRTEFRVSLPLRVEANPSGGP